MSTQRKTALVVGVALAMMTVLGPMAAGAALPAGALGIAALTFTVVAILDVVIALGLYPFLSGAGALLAWTAVVLRITYAAVLVAAAGILVGASDEALFAAIWQLGLFVFGVHLVLVGATAFVGGAIPRWIGVLVGIAGLGYVIDGTLTALAVELGLSVAMATFVGELVLMVWLLGWAGRARMERGEAVTSALREESAVR